MGRTPTAAGVIIGNEVLTAKVIDANGPLLAKRSRERGIALRQLVVVPDEVDAIVEAVSNLQPRVDHLFTSGGIGPTHDDVTIYAVAAALGRRVVRVPELCALVRQHLGEDASEEALRLASAPAGSRLLWGEAPSYPVIACENVYLLPGVPALFRRQVETVLAQVSGTPVHLRCLFLDAPETVIARALDAVARAQPHVSIGSYPAVERGQDYQVKLTVEHEDAQCVEETVVRLRDALPPGVLLRIE